MGGANVSDLSPVAGLINLRFLSFPGNNVSDLSPIAGLINLETLYFWDTKVSDLSPLAGLINLKEVRAPEGVALPPAVIQGGIIHIPDPNLRAVIEEALGTEAITPSAMETLTTLKASDKGILNLAGLELAVNLEELWISENPISDLSPLTGCTNLIRLEAWEIRSSDLSPLANLTKLERLEFRGGVTDISPLVGLTNLRILRFYADDISDISVLTGMRHLRSVQFRHSKVKNLAPLAKLFDLEVLNLHDNLISDISPLRNLTKLRNIDLTYNRISDISPLSMLTNLTELELDFNKILDVSPLAGLKKLERVDLQVNEISDVSPLAGLTNLERLELQHNNIADFSPLVGLQENKEFFWHDNPGFYTQAPKIEGPWLWVFLPNVKLDSSTDLLAQASEDRATEVGIATHGATEEGFVGDDVWISHKLPTTGWKNLDDMLEHPLPNGVLYGTVALNSPREQNTTMYASSRNPLKVWLNGALIYERFDRPWLPRGYNAYTWTEFFPATLLQGRNVLLVAVGTRSDEDSNGFFGFTPGTDYSLAPNVGYVVSETQIHVGDTFTLDIRAENVSDLAGWQFDLAFDPSVLEAIEVSDGDFLKTDGGTVFFQAGRIDNANGKIMGLKAALLSDSGVGGSGTLLRVRFKAKSDGETEVALGNFQFGSFTGENIPAGPLEITFIVEERLATGDVNRDGVVSILDLILVARQLGKSVPSDSPEDINGDGIVNIFDLTLVAQGIGGAAAPAVATGRLDAATIEAWISQARLVNDGSIAFRQGIANLENLLVSLIIPKETALHANYPNPFNPETWIPYQLAEDANVTLTIHDTNGTMVRWLDLGHRAAGSYQSRSRALYWDGRNQYGESVASGLYFYTLRAGEFTATRKMLVRK